mmetsp:Transcript_22184/g.34476  ORF Transcript_22184/g.34476 Transcript_22184/m.34476 type:complete len:219 (+) Transcript_22184:380-1036(+)
MIGMTTPMTKKSIQEIAKQTPTPATNCAILFKNNARFVLAASCTLPASAARRFIHWPEVLVSKKAMSCMSNDRKNSLRNLLVMRSPDKEKRKSDSALQRLPNTIDATRITNNVSISFMGSCSPWPCFTIIFTNWPKIHIRGIEQRVFINILIVAAARIYRSGNAKRKILPTLVCDRDTAHNKLRNAPMKSATANKPTGIIIGERGMGRPGDSGMGVFA